MAICKSCGVFITFEKTKSGKLIPLNIDGKPHWATCSNPNYHRKRKPVKKEPEPGFELDFGCQHKATLETKDGTKCMDCGKIYNESILDWESHGNDLL